MCRSQVDNAIAVNLVNLLSVNKVSRLADFFWIILDFESEFQQAIAPDLKSGELALAILSRMTGCRSV
jgi:hypothetical protein